MLISGYVTRYSKKSVSTIRDLGSYITTRTVSYLLPWATWTFLIRGFLSGKATFFNLKWLAFNMDSGYWFLFSLWTISLIFGFSKYFAEKIIKKDSLFGKLVVVGLFYLGGMAGLALCGFFMGTNFLCIKLTLYYMPFYFCGYLFGALQEKIFSLRHSHLISEITVFGCLFIFIGIVSNVNLFSLEDSGFNILLRAVASMAGCISLCSLLPSAKDTKPIRCLLWLGRHSLGIYLSHYLFLSIIKRAVPPSIFNPSGFALVLVNYVLTVTLTCLLIWLLSHNSVLRFVLFGEKEVKK